MTGAQRRFGPLEWAMSLALAALWGSSFLWIAVAIDQVDAAVVPLLRCGFGFVALLSIPGARGPLPRGDLGRLAFLGLVWMAVPFLLYPLAEQTVSTSITGMINSALPVVTTAVTAAWTAQRPSGQRVFAVCLGALGITAISLASSRGEGQADLGGIALLVTALLFYAVAVNLARPLQDRHGSLPVVLWTAGSATLWSAPLGVPALIAADMTPAVWGAMAILGLLGTGLAFALYGFLLQRAGPVRGMIGVFFSPIVAILLGVMIRDEQLGPVEFLGMGAILIGAALTSRPEASDVATRRPSRLTGPRAAATDVPDGGSA